MKRSLAQLTLPLVVAATSFVAGGVFLNQAQSQPQATSQQPTITIPAPKPPEKAAQDLKAGLDSAKLGESLPRNLFVELSKLINPAVVSITTSQTPKNMRGGYRDPMQEFLEQFWGGRGMRQPHPVQALGTGFIIREDGLIITNNHVVAQADVIKVQLDNDPNKFYEAEVVGRDQLTDIALIKINAKHAVPVAKLGSSKDVQVGEWVAAFGNPYGHAHTMTKGIVSALGREIAEINRFPFIQTDASINPGNSGGPLVNTQGQVIGVNTAIDARAQGIGFAIPIDNVKQIVAQLEKDGRVKRGYIGVNIGTMDESIAAQLGMEEPTGALVADVPQGSPAQKAGIQPYDIIIEVNGHKVAGPTELQNIVAALDIGSKASVKVWRYNDQLKRSEKSFTLTVAENPFDEKGPRGGKTKQYFGQKAPFDLGFKISDWSAQLAQEFELSADGPHAPIITEVEPNSIAARAGFQPGDIIMDVNRQQVAKASDVLRSLKKGRNILRLLRGEMIFIVTLGH